MNGQEMRSSFERFGSLYEFIGIITFVHVRRSRPQIARDTQQLSKIIGRRSLSHASTIVSSPAPLHTKSCNEKSG
jgi:hypothetical protein